MIFVLLFAVGITSGCGTTQQLPIGNEVIIKTLLSAFTSKDTSILSSLLSQNFSLGGLKGTQAITTASTLLQSSPKITDILLKNVEQQGTETVLNTLFKVDGQTETPSTIKLDNGGKISSISYLTDLF